MLSPLWLLNQIRESKKEHGIIDMMTKLRTIKYVLIELPKQTSHDRPQIWLCLSS